MKTTALNFQHISHHSSIIELNSDEQQCITAGGDVADAIGYSVGYAAGTLFVAGPKLATQAICILRFIL